MTFLPFNLFFFFGGGQLLYQTDKCVSYYLYENKGIQVCASFKFFFGPDSNPFFCRAHLSYQLPGIWSHKTSDCWLLPALLSQEGLFSYGLISTPFLYLSNSYQSQKITVEWHLLNFIVYFYTKTIKYLPCLEILQPYPKPASVSRKDTHSHKHAEKPTAWSMCRTERWRVGRMETRRRCFGVM